MICGLLVGYVLSAAPMDSTYTVDIRTDSTINTRLYFITKTLLEKSGHPAKMVVEKGTYILDTSQASSFFEMSPPGGTQALLSGRVHTLQVRHSQNNYRFAPANPHGQTPYWFTLADAKQHLPDSDYVYLHDAIVNRHTFVLHSVISYVAANSEFHNSFCHNPTGITTAISNSVQSGTIDAFGFSFNDSPMTISYSGGIFTRKLNRTECNSQLFQRDPAKAKTGDSDTPYWDYNDVVPDSFYQFVFPAEFRNGKLVTDLESLIALGPARKATFGDPSAKFQCAFLVMYQQLRFVLSPLQGQIVDHAVHGDFSSHLVYRLSESICTFSTDADTAIARIASKMIYASNTARTVGVYLDPEFRVRASLSESHELLGDPRKIIALNIVRYWYRTDAKNYANESYVLCIGAVVKDSLGKNKTRCYWPFNIQLRNSIGAEDFRTLGLFAEGGTVSGEGVFTVMRDSLLTDGTTVFHPVNLFEEYRNGDSFSCRYLLLGNDTGSKIQGIYLVRIGKEKPRQPVSDGTLLPTFVGTYSIPAGTYLQSPTVYPEIKGYIGVASIPFGFGYADTSGLMIIPPQFQSAAVFSESRGRVSNFVYDEDPNKSDVKYTFIDPTGKPVGEYKYDNARDFHESRAAVCLESSRSRKWGFVDLQMNEVVVCQYIEVRDYRNGYAAVRDSSGWFFIDKNGIPLMNERYRHIHDFETGTAVVTEGKKTERKMGIINTKGILIVPVEYDTIGPLSEGLRMVKRDSLYGFMNEKGKMKIAMKYDGANSFLNGCASVSVNHKWGFINAKSKEVVPFIYNWAGYYSGGLYAVKKGKKWGMINLKDSTVVPFQYDSLRIVYAGNFTFFEYGTWHHAPVDGSWYAPDWTGSRDLVLEPDGAAINLSPTTLRFYNNKGRLVGNQYWTTEQGFNAAAEYFAVTYQNAFFSSDRKGRLYFLPN